MCWVTLTLKNVKRRCTLIGKVKLRGRTFSIWTPNLMTDYAPGLRTRAQKSSASKASECKTLGPEFEYWLGPSGALIMHTGIVISNYLAAI